MRNMNVISRIAFLTLMLMECLESLADITMSVNGGKLTFRVLSEEEKTCILREFKPNNSHDTINITIPSQANGYSVISIGNYSFLDCGNLTSLTIPNSVSTIYGYAFRNCSALTSISIPNSVTAIGSGVFEGCSALTNITVEGDNRIYDSRDNCNAIIETVSNVLIAGCQKTIIPASVTSIGEYAFSEVNMESISIPSSVTTIGKSAFSGCSLVSISIPHSVTTIGEYAFSYCKKLTDITVPSSVSVIGNGAFQGSGLRSVILPNTINDISNIVFQDCRSLISISIPSSVISIGDGAFKNCKSLTSITIPNSVTTIGSSALENCSKLKSITIPHSITCIGEDAFHYCDSLSSVTIHCDSVGNWFDWWDPYIKEITLGEGVTKIGRSAFSGCHRLKTITLSNSVTTIYDNAFSGCSALTSISIPNSVTAIGSGVFGGCSTLTSITIPNSVTAIGSGVFGGCSALTNITVEGDNRIYDSRDNCNAIIETVSNVLIAGCQKTIIPASVTSIGEYAFSEVSMESISIPSSVTTIGKNAFLGCGSLISIIIPSSLKSIGSSAFYGCKKLEKVVIPDVKSWCSVNISGYHDNPLNIAHRLYSDENTEITELFLPEGVDTIKRYVFDGCSNLSSIVIPSSVRFIDKEAFSGCIGVAVIIVDKDNEVYDSRDNCNAVISTNTNSLVLGCQNTVIPSTVLSIDDNAFCGCSNLTNIYIPNSVKSIGYNAFADCIKLATLFLSSSVTDIRLYSFNRCDKLKHIVSMITDPSSVITSDVFGSMKDVTLFVPHGTKSAYEAIGGLNDFTIVDIDKDLYFMTEEGVRIKCVLLDDRQQEIQLTHVDASAISVTIPEKVYGLKVNVVDDTFRECDRLLAIVSNAGVHLTSEMLSMAANPNFLLYVKDKDYAPDKVRNVVVNGVAEEIMLKDTAALHNFYCPRTFVAKKITYKHEYKMTTGYNECRGWETIVLPYNVTSIQHENGAYLTPITQEWMPESGMCPFWLYELTDTGWSLSPSIKANKPYLISMPNNPEYYEPEYNISGVVTFVGENVQVIRSDSAVINRYAYSMFVPTYQELAAAESIYALNVNDDSRYTEGSVFEKSRRAVQPFEAYRMYGGVSSSTSPSYIPVFDTDVSTEITEIEKIWASKTERMQCEIKNWYTLDGRKMQSKPTTKGIYIVNGRKVVVK